MEVLKQKNRFVIGDNILNLQGQTNTLKSIYWSVKNPSDYIDYLFFFLQQASDVELKTFSMI